MPKPLQDLHFEIDSWVVFQLGEQLVTDVVQATVIAEDATTAEGLAKAAVIAGSRSAQRLLARAGAWGAVLLRSDGEVIASPSTIAWLVR